MSFLFKSIIYSFLLLLITGSASGPDRYRWTRFRGEGRLGTDPAGNVPVTWDPSDLNWKIQLPGAGNASPVVWDNTIFVTSADDELDTGYLTAVRERDGNILWQKEFSVTDLSLHANNKPDAASPAVDAHHVYVIWYSAEKTELTALDHEGNIKWQSKFGGIESRHGGGSSLMLTEFHVVFTREQENKSSLNSSWVAVDKRTGETAWELERESARANSFATPLLVRPDGADAQLVFASQAHGLTGVDPETGKILWESKDIFPARVVASPIHSDGLIIASRKGKASVFDLDRLNRQVADPARYSLPPNLSPYVPTPIVVGDLLFLFMDNGSVACVKLASGDLLWRERPAGAIFGSPVCVGGNLYCITKEGEVIVLDAGPVYQLSGIQNLGEGSFSTPVVSRSGMVFRTFSQLMLLGNKPS